MIPGTSNARPAEKAAPRRLRSSCDSCGSAKVRCDRDRPQCRRCVTLGVSCNYSASRKIGKPPRKSLHTGANSKDTVEIPGVYAAALPDDRLIDSVRSAFGQHQHQSSVMSQPPLRSNVGDETPSLSAELSPLVQRPSSGDQVDPFNTLGFGEWPNLDVLDDGFVMTTPLVASTVGVEMQMVRSPKEMHSCARESYEILAGLVCPAPNLHAPFTNSEIATAQLDQVLHFNRKAMARLTDLLGCPCARSGHRVMVHAAIISRMLIWYQQAAGYPSHHVSSEHHPAGATVTDGDFEPSTSLSPMLEPAQDPGTRSLQRLPEVTGFVVTDVPAALGTFGIEDQKMQAAIRNHLVLNELSIMASLINLFCSQSSRDSAVDVASLSTHTTAWLRNEYSCLVRDLTARRQEIGQIQGL